MKARHYPLLDKGVNVSGLEIFDLALMVGSFLLVLVLSFPILKNYCIFAAVPTAMFMFVFLRRKKTGKNSGYIARKIMFKYLRRYHKIY